MAKSTASLIGRITLNLGKASKKFDVRPRQIRNILDIPGDYHTRVPRKKLSGLNSRIVELLTYKKDRSFYEAL